MMIQMRVTQRRAVDKVRKQKVNRFKYYYEVAEFDSEKSANKVT